MVSKTATWIVVLGVLLGGVLTPTEACALMCVRHDRAESQGHCRRPVKAIADAAMVHHHSAGNQAAVEALSSALVRQSCQSNCITALRLTGYREALPHGRSSPANTLAVDATAGTLAPDHAANWLSDGTPPGLTSTYRPSFEVLRV